VTVLGTIGAAGGALRIAAAWGDAKDEDEDADEDADKDEEEKDASGLGAALSAATGPSPERRLGVKSSSLASAARHRCTCRQPERE